MKQRTHEQMAFPFIHTKRGIRTKPPSRHDRSRASFSRIYTEYMASELWQRKREEASRFALSSR